MPLLLLARPDLQVAMVWSAFFTSIMLLGSGAVAWLIITRLPSDYLTRPTATWSSSSASGMLRLLTFTIRNVLGVVIVAAGLIMLITPGQGVISIVIGLTMMDFPGKHGLIQRILSRPHVINAINRVRTKAHRPPLELPSNSALGR